MALTSAFVVYAVLWFLVLFLVLPYRMKSQGDAGEVVPGTPASAPANPMMKRKFKIMTRQIIVLKEEIQQKDQALVKEHFDKEKVKHEKELMTRDLATVREKLKVSRGGGAAV